MWCREDSNAVRAAGASAAVLFASFLLATMPASGATPRSGASVLAGDALGADVKPDVRQTDALVDAITKTGGRLGATETTCLAKSTVPDASNALLSCLSQETELSFIVRRWGALSNADGSPGTSAICLERRLRTATWSEVGEMFRAALSVATTTTARGNITNNSATTNTTRRGAAQKTVLNNRSNAGVGDYRLFGVTGILASRVAPYADACDVGADALVRLPQVTVEQMRVRWNAAVDRATTPFSRLTQLIPTADNTSSSDPSVFGVIAPNTRLSLSTDTDEHVVGLSVFLHPPTADATAVTSAIALLAETVDGRANASRVLATIGVQQFFASGRRPRKAVVGHTTYNLTVGADAQAVTILASWL